MHQMTDLLRNYKNWAYSQNSRHYDEDDEFFQPYFAWNPFDYRNNWQPEWLKEFMCGLSGFGYAWECWTYLMRDKKYSYQLPNAFWLELNGVR